MVVQPPNPCRILLVEDNKMNLELAKILFERDGHQVEEAENGEKIDSVEKILAIEKDL